MKLAHLRVKQHVTWTVARARCSTTVSDACSCGITQVHVVVDRYNLPFLANATHEYSMQYNINAGSAYALTRHHASLCRRFVERLTSPAGTVACMWSLSGSDL